MTATLDAGTAAAANLITIDSNTTTAVAATAVTQITGTAANSDGNGIDWLTDAANVTATVDAGTAAAADPVIDTNTRPQLQPVLLLDHRYCRKYCDGNGIDWHY